MIKKRTAPPPYVQPYRYPSPHIPLAAIRRFARQIAERFHPDKIILFGSYAYGQPHSESDVDLLVIMPAHDVVNQEIRIGLALDRPFSHDIVVRTPKQIERGLREDDCDWFLREVMEKGKVLYESPHCAVGSQGRRRHPMDYPVIFPLRESLAHRSPDDVRRTLQMNSFRQHSTEHTPYSNPRARGFSEIWSKLAGRGYAVVRIDTQGHARLAHRGGDEYEIQGAAGTHSAVPHFHKEWIAAELFSQYVSQYVPQVVRYDDAGDPVTGAMTDAKAKQTHIKQ